MSEPWTPGPWRVNDERANPADRRGAYRYYVLGPHSEVAAATNGEATACLIALAPEMAELLESFASWSDPPTAMEAEVLEASALLVRARGVEVPA